MMFYTNEEDMILENRISRNTGRILHDLDLICCCFDELGRINTEDIYTGLAGTSGRDALNNLNEKLFPSARGYDICFGEFISSADRFLAKEKHGENFLRVLIYLNNIFVPFFDAAVSGPEGKLRNSPTDVICSTCLLSAKDIASVCDTLRSKPEGTTLDRLGHLKFVKPDDNKTLGDMMKSASLLAKEALTEIRRERLRNSYYSSCRTADSDKANAAYNITKHLLINPVRLFEYKRRNGNDSQILWVSAQG